MTRHSYEAKVEALLAGGQPEWAKGIKLVHGDECTLLSAPLHGRCDCDPDVSWSSRIPDSALFIRHYLTWAK